MLHLSPEIGRLCKWCGEDVVQADSTTSREDWKASKDACRYHCPITTAIFTQDGEWCQFGMDEDAIKINDRDLDERSKQFTPLIKRDGSIFSIEIPDLRSTAFTWEPKTIEEKAVREIITMPTFHSCGYYGFFKPSIAEVLAQMPFGSDMSANAFYIDRVRICRDGNGHIGETHWVEIT